MQTRSSAVSVLEISGMARRRIRRKVDRRLGED
jgi:hypothetical protein